MLLVTGATGFIGRHLLDTLASTGEAVRCLVRRRNITPPLPSCAQMVFGDLATGEGVSGALEGVDAVIHLAGITKALRAADYYSGNAHAAGTLARAVAGRPIRLLHVSSLAAIGPGSMVAEDSEPRPVSDYGRSKLEAERIVRAAVPDAVIVRPPVVYGPRDTDVFQILKSVSRGMAVEIAGGDRWFSAIYVKDLVEGILAAARHPRAAGRTYFLAHPKPLTWRDLGAVAARIMGRKQPRAIRVPLSAAFAVGWCAETWSRITGKPGIISRAKVAEARWPSWTCSSERASAELGFQASTGLEDGLAQTLAWYKEAGWLNY
jgi:nucleoside-diphosphate-sugar epimerase